MQFSPLQQEIFKAKRGSYSIVTEREVHDSQITATDAETNLLRAYFLSIGEDIHVGNVRSDPEKAEKEFKLYPNGTKIYLNLVYPKPRRSELRLYIARSRGYFPQAGEVWFLYESAVDNALWIGALPEKEFRNLGARWREDEEDLIIPQESNIIAPDGTLVTDENTEIIKERELKIVSRRGYYATRNRELAIKCMQSQKYKCGYDREHKLFEAKATGCNYLEVHHIIPVKFQAQFRGMKLDSLHNLVGLCPFCHRAIHHAEDRLVRNILDKVIETHDIKKHFGLEKPDIYQLYAVEDIVK